MPRTLQTASSTGEKQRGRSLQDPARALRLAIRNYDEPKLALLIEWLLNGVPLLWDAQYPLARCRVIRGRVAPGDDGFAFALDEATGVVSELRRPDEVPQMAKGDRVVRARASNPDGQAPPPPPPLPPPLPLSLPLPSLNPQHALRLDAPLGRSRSMGGRWARRGWARRWSRSRWLS